MRTSPRWSVILAVTALGAVACGGGTSTATPSTTAPPTSPLVGATTTASPSGASTVTGTGAQATTTPCGAPAATIAAAVAPKVEIQAPGSSAQAVTAKVAVACTSVIRIDQSGAANLSFAGIADCQFVQDAPTAKVATAVAREPDGTLMRVQEGTVFCTVMNNHRIQLCGSGDIQVDGQVNQLKATCNPDPVFAVSLNQGFAKVVDPSGASYTVGQGQGLDYSYAQKHSSTDAASFTTREQAIFAAQVSQMGLRSTATTAAGAATTVPASTTTAPPP